MSEPNEPDDALERLKRFQIGDIVPSDGQIINLSIDGAAFMNWFRDYTSAVGGVPLTIRNEGGHIPPPKEIRVAEEGPETVVPQPEPTDEEGSGEVNG